MRLIGLVFVFTIAVQAQSIRKDYKEMSSQERSEYVRVMNQLYSEAVISNFVTSHRMTPVGFAQHGNDDFLPWHRIFLYYMDKEIKAKNRYLNLSYINWYQSGGVDASEILFSSGNDLQGLLGLPLNSNWGNEIIDRRFEIQGNRNSWHPNQFFNATKSTNISAAYTIFRQNLEGFPHNSFHVWVGGNGGTMGSITSSPLDPVFYFHHTMVDKDWHDWNTNIWNGTDFGRVRDSLGSIIGKPTYNGKTLFDARASKLWYAENGKVVLDKYTVSNQTLGVTTGKEFYFYTGNISVGGSNINYFTVPSGTEAKIESMKEIALLPGFSAESGSSFGAEVITAFPTGTGFAGSRIANESEGFKIETSKKISDFNIYPNPNRGEFTINPINIEVYKIEIFDLNSKPVAFIQQDFLVKLNVESGVYLIVITDENGIMYSHSVLIE